MGSSSSKSASSGNGNEYKSSNGAASPDQTKKTGTQTSIYGWGRIKHPFKPGGRNNKTGEPQAAKGKAKKHNGFQVNEIRMPTPTTATPVSSPAGEPQKDEANAKGATDNEIKENGNHKETATVTDAAGVGTPSSSPSPSPAPGTTPFRKQVLSNPSFYGHYRCPNCTKYWRSGHSKEGCAQNCSKCGTPTTPRR